MRHRVSLQQRRPGRSPAGRLPTKREKREAVLGKAQLIYEGDGEYLGVAFSAVDREPKVGEEVIVEMAFMYFPAVSYREAVPGATFTLREGARIVGFGEILEVTEKEASRANQSAETTAVECPPSNHGSRPAVSHL